MVETADAQVMLSARVAARHEIAPRTIALVLQACDSGGPLPQWTAGAHIDVHTPHGVRNYSLCGDENEPVWSIAVQRDDEGQGGSVWLHDNARPGSEIAVGPPRNAFALEPASGYLFVAGGIGITPLIPMIRRARRDGVPWRLVYTAREGHHAFADELVADPNVVLWASGRDGRLDIRALVGEAASDTLVYCCGPDALMDAVVEAGAAAGIAVRTERFRQAPRADDKPFTIELARSGRTVDVPAARTALEVLNEAGVFVPSSCRAGHCGTCEVEVVTGDIDHRDDVLTDEERAEGDCMFPCVSRGRGHLVVDL